MAFLRLGQLNAAASIPSITDAAARAAGYQSASIADMAAQSAGYANAAALEAAQAAAGHQPAAGIPGWNYGTSAAPSSVATQNAAASSQNSIVSAAETALAAAATAGPFETEDVVKAHIAANYPQLSAAQQAIVLDSVMEAQDATLSAQTAANVAKAASAAQIGPGTNPKVQTQLLQSSIKTMQQTTAASATAELEGEQSPASGAGSAADKVLSSPLIQAPTPYQLAVQSAAIQEAAKLTGAALSPTQVAAVKAATTSAQQIAAAQPPPATSSASSPTVVQTDAGASSTLATVSSPAVAAPSSGAATAPASGPTDQEVESAVNEITPVAQANVVAAASSSTPASSGSAVLWLGAAGAVLSGFFGGKHK